jgi:DNA modification methylase
VLSKSNQMVVQRVPIDSVRPMEPSVRTHSKKQDRGALRSFENYGQLLPLPTSETGEILDLQMMWTAMKAAGATHVDVVVIKHKTPAELKAIRLMLNRLAQDASWNDEGLRKVFQELLTVDFDLDLTGFSPPEIDFRLSADLPGGNVEENGSDIPPLGKNAVTARGMIWQLGRNRVGCGDATDAPFVATVLDGAKASAAFTDPPWNIPVDGFISGKGKHRHREFVQGVGELSEDEFFAFLCRLLSVLQASCKPSALVYCCIDWRSITALNVAARHCGMALYNIAVWTKTNGGMGGIYRNAHEMIPIYAAGNEPPLNNVELGRHGRNRTNVWSYPGMNSFGRDRDALLGSHPTAKPVVLVADALRDVTKRGDVVIDTFLGSGTTLMAAQETGRICCGTELDPLYVDLIVRRWQTATGQDAVNADTGETFSAVSQKLLPGPAGSANG